MRFFTPSLLIVAAFVLGGIAFKASSPTTCDAIMSGDNIFVLTGDARRIPFAVRLMRQNPTTELYIIGAGANTVFQDNHRITVESSSKSTYQNARAIKKIAMDKKLDRLVLVTTEEHMIRASHLVRHELPDVDISVCPIRLVGTPPARRLQRWTTEYIKFLVTQLGIREG